MEWMKSVLVCVYKTICMTLFIFWGTSFSAIALSEYSLTPSKQFEKDCALYLIEPGWVISACIGIQVNEFDVIWATLVSYFKDYPEYFFDEKKSDYSEKKHRSLMIQYCQEYDIFLRHAKVDTVSKQVLLFEKNYFNALDQGQYVTLFQYWQVKKNTTQHHFYAFYFDCIAAQFVETVTNAFLQIDMPEYKECQKEADKLLKQLKIIFKYVQGSEYDARYSQHIKRYTEVFQLLKKEQLEQQKEQE